MSSSEPLSVAAARSRLEHLRTLPESPMRRREIASLERTLASGAFDQAPKPRKRIPADRDLTEQDLDDRVDAPVPAPVPLREVQRVEGRRRVIIRAARNIDKEDDVETAAMIRERERRRGDIQAIVGLRFRGDD